MKLRPSIALLGVLAASVLTASAADASIFHRHHHHHHHRRYR